MKLRMIFVGLLTGYLMQGTFKTAQASDPADVLTADAAEAFAEAPGGFYDKEVAAKLVQHLFAPRNAVDPGEAYRAFRGREPRMEALKHNRGFPAPRAASRIERNGSAGEWRVASYGYPPVRLFEVV